MRAICCLSNIMTIITEGIIKRKIKIKQLKQIMGIIIKEIIIKVEILKQ